MLKLSIFLLIFTITISQTHSQNIRLRPTSLDVRDAETIRVPTPIRRFDVPLVQVEGMRLEVHTRHYAVFSDTSAFSENRRLYVWDDFNKELRDTQEIAVPESLLISEDEKYIIYIVDESEGGADINGDRTLSTGVLRMYHLETGQRINLGIPARSATPIPTLQSRSQFEYSLNQNTFIFSTSSTEQNSNRESDAPWSIIDMELIIFEIEGTPTPTPTNTPTPTPTPIFTSTNTPTPSATATDTPIPAVPPGFVKSSDINTDGFVNQLDLLILREFWFVEPTPTPFME